MSKPKPYYSWYVTEYGGTVPEAAFDASLTAACSLVDYLLGWREPEGDGQEQAYMRACCAACEAFAMYGQGQSGGFSIGSFSVSGGASSGTDLASEAARRELALTGLLFCGVV